MQRKEKRRIRWLGVIPRSHCLSSEYSARLATNPRSKTVSRRVYKSSWVPLSWIYYFAGLSNHTFSHNWPNIVFDCTERGISYNSRKKSRILIGKTKNSNLDRGKFQANHYFMLVQNKKEGRLNNVSNGSINSPSSFKKNFRWYCYYYYYCLWPGNPLFCCVSFYFA